MRFTPTGIPMTCRPCPRLDLDSSSSQRAMAATKV
jgi:hypothetical protein